MRHALITAGTKGLGKKVAEKLLEKGYSLTLSYRSDLQAVDRMKREWKEWQSRLQFVQVDVTRQEQLQKMVEKAMEKFGRIDMLVNNAGPYIFERKKLIDYTTEEWNEMINGNLTAMFHLLKLVLPIMRKQQYGRIVTYGFQGAQTAPAWIYRSAYAAAKSGLVSLTKTISVEEAPYGITANMVCPGVVTDEFKEAGIEKAREITDTNTPVGRPATGEDIARTIAFLCEENSDMITGSIIEVTGGVDVLHKHR
ncbi:SDR family oxidoreductase [Aliibacillus thermotolerans]|uniref:SDR family oxidoreductase n=1 Tax=Aliibacillus thermotolerans TaxID=1834418 RepID=A0ABW0U7N1_9BACI|nr:SDR family oxidoreductase [Aliibacillus thermotolerans]MDA3129808.1 SDR family oxidoreductase [Aliibacillus thermotolerans]